MPLVLRQIKNFGTKTIFQNLWTTTVTKTDCYFSTYAATGNLKRALKEKGFLLEKKAGFGFKRESTFATRSL